MTDRAGDAARAPPADGLTAEQRRTVAWEDGPLVVVAGAGTGKTRVSSSSICLTSWSGTILPTRNGGCLPGRGHRREAWANPGAAAADPVTALGQAVTLVTPRAGA